MQILGFHLILRTIAIKTCNTVDLPKVCIFAEACESDMLFL